MPIVAYKTMDLDVVWVQVRAIRCEACHNGYRYLASDTRRFSTAGLPLVSSDEGMRKVVTDQAQKTLEKLAKKDRKGAGRCPHCGRYQGWMVRASRWSRYPRGLGLGLLGGAAVAVVPSVALADEPATAGVILGAGTLLGALLGGWQAWRKVLKGGLHPGPADPCARTDDGWEAFLRTCQEQDHHPALSWYAAVGGQFRPKVPVIPLPTYEERRA